MALAGLRHWKAGSGHMAEASAKLLRCWTLMATGGSLRARRGRVSSRAVQERKTVNPSFGDLLGLGISWVCEVSEVFV